MNVAINNTTSTNPVIQLNTGNIHALKEENTHLNKELQYLAAEQAKLKVQMTQHWDQKPRIHTNYARYSWGTKRNRRYLLWQNLPWTANTIAGSDPEERYTTAKTLTIRKCCRLGKFKRDRIRPVSIEFVCKEDRSYVLENRSYFEQRNLCW